MKISIAIAITALLLEVQVVALERSFKHAVASDTHQPAVAQCRVWRTLPKFR